MPYVAQAVGMSPERLQGAFRPATETDLPGILALRRAAAREMWWDDARFVRWRYFDGRGPGPTPYWVLERDGEIVGACGLEPVILVVDGEPTEAVRTLDIMVHPGLEGRGLGAFMNLVLFDRFPITIVTGSNPASHHLLTRMFHHTLDLVFWKALIESRGLIETRLPLGPLAGVVAVGADAALALARRARRRKPRSGLDIRELTSFDQRATELALRVERPGRIMVRRDAEYLNWRFLRNPRCEYRAFGAFAGDRMAGYLVSRFNLARPNPRREGEVVDWLADDSHDDGLSPLDALLATALDTHVEAGAGLVTCAAYGAGIEAAARANGFRLRERQTIPFFVRAAQEDVHRRLSSGEGWFVTRGDLDVE